MPEAAVDEDDRLDAAQHDIGRARQVAVMEAKTQARRVDRAADLEFGLGVLAANRRHNAATHGGDAWQRSTSHRRYDYSGSVGGKTTSTALAINLIDSRTAASASEALSQRVPMAVEMPDR